MARNCTLFQVAAQPALDLQAAACRSSTVPVYLLLLITCCGYAIWRGGAPERIAAAILMAGSVLTAMVSTPATRGAGITWPVFIIDLTDQLLLMLLAVYAKRYWTIVAAGIHLLPIAVHVARGLVPAIQAPVYDRAVVVASYLILLLIAAGTQRHRLRRRRFGTDVSWSTFSMRRASAPPTKSRRPF